MAKSESRKDIRSPLKPIRIRPFGKTVHRAGQYISLLCHHIQADQNIDRWCWLFGPHSGTFEENGSLVHAPLIKKFGSLS